VVEVTGVNAYAAIQAQAEKLKSLGAGPVQETGAPGFGEMLQQVLTDTVSQSKAAEAAMTAQVQGKAELIDVVTAITAAETSLETMIAVRDQVIAAYQEIMRMPI
jgi:flagellar hook-basal body complex protein FliE